MADVGLPHREVTALFRRSGRVLDRRNARAPGRRSARRTARRHAPMRLGLEEQIGRPDRRDRRRAEGRGRVAHGRTMTGQEVKGSRIDPIRAGHTGGRAGRRVTAGRRDPETIDLTIDPPAIGPITVPPATGPPVGAIDLTIDQPVAIGAIGAIGHSREGMNRRAAAESEHDPITPDRSQRDRDQRVRRGHGLRDRTTRTRTDHLIKMAAEGSRGTYEARNRGSSRPGPG